jgi:hypothetical protein
LPKWRAIRNRLWRPDKDQPFNQLLPLLLFVTSRLLACACKEVAGLAIDGRIDQTIVKTIAGTIASLMRPNMVFWLVVSTPLRNIIYSHLGL